jgi:ABC-type transport system involved in cytochrome c biogenesis permease subunit
MAIADRPKTPPPTPSGYPGQNHLRTLAVVNALAIIGLTFVVFMPTVQQWRVESRQEPVTFTVPDYAAAYKAWRTLPSQVDGRTKPFETYAVEAVRTIHGRAKMAAASPKSPAAKDPVAVVLDWMLLQGSGLGTTFTEWETFPFILCEHHGLRAWIYAHKLGGEEFLEKLKNTEVVGQAPADVQSRITELSNELTAYLAKTKPDDAAEAKEREEKLHGKFIAPADLRGSTGIMLLLDKASELREEDRDKAMQYMAPEQRKAEEVAGRLKLFDGICQSSPPQLRKRAKGAIQEDPLHLVALDRVPGSAWLSLGELRNVLTDPQTKWRELLQERLKGTPQDYINPEQRETLRAFQEQIKARQGDKALNEVSDKLAERRADDIKNFRKRWSTEKVAIPEVISDPVFQQFDRKYLDDMAAWVRSTKDEKDQLPMAGLATEIEKTLKARDDEDLKQFKGRIEAAERGRASGFGTIAYDPADPHYRMLHLDYLEMLYPTLYLDALAWQPFPADEAEKVLTSFTELQTAYKSEDAEQFLKASEAFFAVLAEVSNRTALSGFTAAHQPEALRSAAAAALENPEADPSALKTAMAEAGFSPDYYLYPGTPTIGMEMTFNRVQPFMWAWVLMLPAVLVFALCQSSGSRWLYVVGIGLYLASLGFQFYGFGARVAIAGRPPVSNMYETVIFVAFMSGIFALILEIVYRKTIFALAGAAVSTVALVLADQLPLVLDPKISPLVPVLRSNLWLIVHVMTIVASYAGGTLAWGLGNISLAMLAFGRPKPDTVKMLAQYTKRALEIAVLLLAIGTFLGGVWAAFSWGRFWGWDPKETWALIALVVYVIPLHARYIGWVKDFGLAVGAVLCYAAIVMCWYGVNFVLGAGLHSYGFGGGGPYWVLWAGLINVQWVLMASMMYLARKHLPQGPAAPQLA